MYQVLLTVHSAFRWLVLISLFYALYRAAKGYYSNSVYSKTDNAVRHWTATIAHIQLVIGMTLYTQSPIIQYFWTNKQEAVQHMDILFFSLIHLILMMTAIVVITIGSSLAKRKDFSREKYKTQLIWFLLALLIIFMAIPWPFSPLAGRPYFR